MIPSCNTDFIALKPLQGFPFQMDCYQVFLLFLLYIIEFEKSFTLVDLPACIFPIEVWEVQPQEFSLKALTPDCCWLANSPNLSEVSSDSPIFETNCSCFRFMAITNLVNSVSAIACLS